MNTATLDQITQARCDEGMMDTYELRPRPTADGYNLAGPALPHDLWFRSASDAANYAHSMLRHAGGRIIARDSRGASVTVEHVAAHGEGYGHACT